MNVMNFDPTKDVIMLRLVSKRMEGAGGWPKEIYPTEEFVLLARQALRDQLERAGVSVPLDRIIAVDGSLFFDVLHPIDAEERDRFLNPLISQTL